MNQLYLALILHGLIYIRAFIVNLIYYSGMKQNRVCKQINIKSQNELKLFQEREAHYF